MGQKRHCNVREGFGLLKVPGEGMNLWWASCSEKQAASSPQQMSRADLAAELSVYLA